MASQSKFMIFIYIIFVVIAVVFITEISRFLKDGFSAIDSKKNQFQCSTVDFEIINIKYEQTNLEAQISNSNNAINITKLVIISDLEKEEKIINLPNKLQVGQSQNFKLEKFYFDKSYYIYVNDCKTKGKTINK